MRFPKLDADGLALGPLPPCPGCGGELALVHESLVRCLDENCGWEKWDVGEGGDEEEAPGETPYGEKQVNNIFEAIVLMERQNVSVVQITLDQLKRGVYEGVELGSRRSLWFGIAIGLVVGISGGIIHAFLRGM